MKCNCAYNQSSKCEHIAALIWFINNEESLSNTNNEKEVAKPGAQQFLNKKDLKARYLQGTKKKCCEEVELKLEQEDCTEYLNNFSMLREEFKVYHNDYKLGSHLKEFYDKTIVMTDDDIVRISCETIEQSKCPKWFAIRRLRISASTNVHNIITRTRKTVESLVSSILHRRKFSCAAVTYGLNNELCAIQEYEQSNSCKVKRVGVIVSKCQPWLCASIDGVVVKDGRVTKLVEVKCPITCNKQSVVNMKRKLCNVEYLEFLNNELKLKKSKPYYTQVQVQMYITGLTMCDLFVYSPVRSITVHVNRDEEFIRNMILKSELFYFEHYLPALYTVITNDSGNKVEQKRDFIGSDIVNRMNE